MSLIISATAIALSYRTYANTMDEHYQKMCLDLAESAITMLDSEKMKYYAETLEKDEYYDEQRDILCRLVEANDSALYIYVATALGGGDVREGATLYDIMDTDPTVMPPEEEVAYLDVEAGDDIVFISQTEEFGWLCTAVVWMYDETRRHLCVYERGHLHERRDGGPDGLSAGCSFCHSACHGRCLRDPGAAGEPVCSQPHQSGSPCRPAVRVRPPHQRGALRLHRRAPDCDREKGEEKSAISQLNIHTGDEIQALSEAIKTMEVEINEYIQDLTTVTAEKERIGAELNVATQIQADMLPRIFPAFPEREEFDVYATMNPAKEVGGDFYDFFLVDDDHLAVVIADVSGKGVPAALFMVIAKTLIKNHTQNQEEPGAVFTQTNEQLCEGNDAGLFVTAWMGVLEISTGKFVYVNAGHNPPLLKRAGGQFEWLKSRPGFVLAGMEGVRYRENTLRGAWRPPLSVHRRRYRGHRQPQ